jgi:hypothetical protein
MAKVTSSGGYLCRNCDTYVMWAGDPPREAQPLCGRCDPVHLARPEINEAKEERGSNGA